MNYQNTINEIFKGLSGNNEADLKYLHKQIEEHKDDKNSIEITRALGRKIFELLPDDAKVKLNQIIGNDVETINSTIQEAKFLLSSNKPAEAEQLLKSALESIPFEFNDDEECGYFCFNNALEAAIFTVSEKYKKTIRKPTYNFAEIYFLYAYSLFENNKIDDAEVALKTAFKWNPVSTNIISELSEIYKRKKDYDNFLYWSKKILQYALSSKMLAKAYRNIAYYYCDIEEFETSAAIYHFSRAYEENTLVTSELYYIAEKLGKLPEAPTPEYIDMLFKKNHIQYGANDIVVGVAYQLSNTFLDNNDFENALYYLSIIYDLTHKKDILELIKKIKNSPDNE